MYDYDRITSIALNKITQKRIKSIEEGWEKTFKEARSACYFNFGGTNASDFGNLVEESKAISYRMLIQIIIDLFNQGGIDIKPYWDDEGELECIVAPHGEKKVVYVFNEYSKAATWTAPYQEKMIKKYSVDVCIGVSYMRDYAYTVVLNHNDNLKDPMRGTNQLSFSHFFMFYFGMSEYQRFEAAIDKYEKEVQKILGIKAISTLETGAINNFKRMLALHIIQSVDKYVKRIPANSCVDVELMRDRFVEKRLYTALTGDNLYSQSLITAEWLYDTMKNSGQIDYVPVAMGYIKCIEQLMRAIVLLHKNSGKTIKRRVFKGDEKYTYINHKGKTQYEMYVPLNDENIEEDRIDTTLGAMINSFYKQYRDIYCAEYSDSTIEYIRSRLETIAPLRNGYFHKDNISEKEWDIVEKAKACAYEVTFLLLGGCSFTQEQIRNIGVADREIDDYQKLCQYINDHSDMKLYFLKSENASEEECTVCGNGYCEMEYDEHGNVIYKNIKFSVLGMNKIIQIDNNNLPYIIKVGTLNMSDLSKLFAGPREVIFENGVFCGDMDEGKINYKI